MRRGAARRALCVQCTCTKAKCIFRRMRVSVCTGWFITYVYRTAWRGVAWRAAPLPRSGSCQTAVRGFLPGRAAFTIIARIRLQLLPTTETAVADAQRFRRARRSRNRLRIRDPRRRNNAITRARARKEPGRRRARSVPCASSPLRPPFYRLS